MIESGNIKECFVMMPIEDCDGYEPGHFRKVYEELIKPALIEAGVIPVRADELNAGADIQIEVIKRLINSPLVICDLSSLNREISIGLGIRKSYKKPTVLLWDDITPKAYYLHDISCIDYLNSLNKNNIKYVRKKLKESVRTILRGC